MKRIYLDNAAATPIDPRVVWAMVKAAKMVGNPSAVASEGLQAAQFLHACRKSVADFLGAAPGEIIFTSSGSEGNSLAILGLGGVGKNIITAPTEHKSVLEAVKKSGVQVRMLTVDGRGNIDLKELASLIDARTVLVSLMYANNEIGTVHPIAKIARVVRDARKKNRSAYPYFHTDACQATAWLSMNAQNLGVDLMTINGAKVYGPRGAGALFVRRGVPLAPRTVGGDQEHGMRAGTEDLMSIAGFATALNLVRPADTSKIARLRNLAWKGIQKALPDARLNGPDLNDRLANNLSISFADVQSEPLLLELDEWGIAASAGSACTAKSTGASHVLTAIAVPARYRAGTIRFSLSRYTTKKDIDTLVKVLPQAVAKIRSRSLK